LSEKPKVPRAESVEFECRNVSESPAHPGALARRELGGLVTTTRSGSRPVWLR
jgi:hypothetical protein